MTFVLHLWPLTSWTTCEDSLYQYAKFGSSRSSTFQMRWILHFEIILQLDLWWPLTTWTYKGSHNVSINQVWFQSDFNFSIEATFTFSAYSTTWPQMTFDPDMWPLTSSTNEGSHVASMTQLWLKSIKACGSYSQMLTCFHRQLQQQQTTPPKDNRGQSDPYVSFLLRQATQKQAITCSNMSRILVQASTSS